MEKESHIKYISKKKCTNTSTYTCAKWQRHIVQVSTSINTYTLHIRLYTYHILLAHTRDSHKGNVIKTVKINLLLFKLLTFSFFLFLRSFSFLFDIQKKNCLLPSFYHWIAVIVCPLFIIVILLSSFFFFLFGASVCASQKCAYSLCLLPVLCIQFDWMT